MLIVFNNEDTVKFEQPTEFYYTQGMLCVYEKSTNEWYEYSVDTISVIIPTHEQ